MPSAAPMTATRPKVLFIRGIAPRSGTNFLRDAAVCHPLVCWARPGLWEDRALDDAAQLERYVRAVVRRWPAEWDLPTAQIRLQLLQELGDGLVRALIQNPKRPDLMPAAKSPSVLGLEHFFELFPADPLIVLVRDGRAVVESTMRSFGSTFERATHQWAAGADTILKFRRDHADSQGTSWLLLRYEDALDDLPGTLRRIADLAGIDPDAYNIDKAGALGVRGSSTFETEDGQPHWRPVPKDESFDPLARFADWDDERHRRFNAIAGEQMEQLGYPLHGEPSHGLAAALRHQPRDLYFSVDAAARRAKHRWLAR